MLMFDGTERSDILTGTAEEVAGKFNRIRNINLKVDRDKNGLLGYFIRFALEECDAWELCDHIHALGTMKANLTEAYNAYFKDFIMQDDCGDFRVFVLDTPERKELFDWDHDELLDFITAKEFRDAGLDWDEECDFEVH